MMGNGKKYIARCRNASFREFLYRGRQALATEFLRVSGRMATVARNAPVPDRGTIQKLHMPELRLEGHPHALGKCPPGSPETQELFRRCEALHAGRFPRDTGSMSLPCDIRSLWEPARLQAMAEACVSLREIDEEDRRAEMEETARSGIIGWLERNPFPLGLHYLSAMECGLRIPVFFYALKLLRLTDKDFASIGRAVWRHAWLIRGRLSLYSSLGNHTIAECAGLAFAAALFPGSHEGRDWLDTSVSLLRREISHQILADGGPVEQSFAYHRFVLDLYWLVKDFLGRNGLADLGELQPRLRAGEEFLAAFLDRRGNVPPIGDADDGRAVAPCVAPARWEAPVPETGVRTFPDAGYTVFRCGCGALLTFDHGPLGMPPLYNHGHADALSITFSLEGVPFLVDPGTFRYNGDPESRAWFKGTRSHCTVTIDGEDQAVQETGFIWSRPYRSGIVTRRDKDAVTRLEAIHDGYARLREPVRHKRSVLRFDEGCFLIRDVFWGEGVHLYETNLHIHPDARIRREGSWWLLENDGRAVSVLVADCREAMEDDSEPCLHAGWFSPAYGTKRESSILRLSRRGFPHEVAFSTIIRAGRPLEEGRKERLLCSASQIG